MALGVISVRLVPKQCFKRAHLYRATCRGLGGPHDSGSYNSSAWDTGFFVSDGGSWDSEYGRFFLDWYAGMLERHADAMLAAAAGALHGRRQPQRAAGVKQVLRRLASSTRVRTSGIKTT